MILKQEEGWSRRSIVHLLRCFSFVYYITAAMSLNVFHGLSNSAEETARSEKSF